MSNLVCTGTLPSPTAVDGEPLEGATLISHRRLLLRALYCNSPLVHGFFRAQLEVDFLLPFASRFLRRRTWAKMSSSSAGPSSKPRTGSSQPSETSSKRKRGVFQKELQHMMYGFGDDPNPLPESVALMEDIVVEYVTELVHRAQDIGSQRGKLSVEDFLYLIRKDLPKLNRCTELLSMNEELKQARKVFESDEEKLRKVFEADEPVE